MRVLKCVVKLVRRFAEGNCTHKICASFGAFMARTKSVTLIKTIKKVFKYR